MMIFLTVVFAGFYSVLGQRQVMIAERQVSLQAEAVANKIGYELDLALTQGEGYSRQFTLPDRIGNADYNISVINGTIVVAWLDSQVLSTTAVDGINGTLQPGTNRIRNTGTAIEVVSD